MKLSLNEIIEQPGKESPFEYDLDAASLEFIQVKAMKEPLRIKGRVRNIAGALELTAEISADMVCICDRCMEEYSLRKTIPVTAHLADQICDEENSDIFLLDGSELDLDEIMTTAFVLDMDSKFVCKEDCLGLCTQCGANLNTEPCNCGDEPDPRLAALRQLLPEE